MPKIRINIANREIVMKDIINVIIDGVEYKKSDYINENDTRIVQGYYHFVKKFKEKITFICFKNRGATDYLCFIYMENGKPHSLTDYAICDIMLGTEYRRGDYFVNGEELNFTEWQRKVRKAKLEKIIKK